MLSSDSQESVETEEQCRGTTSLQNELVREDEHARLGEQIGIHMLGVKNGQDFAVDHVQHINPGVGGNGLQPIGFCTVWKSIGARGQPNLEQLLRPYNDDAG